MLKLRNYHHRAPGTVINTQLELRHTSEQTSLQTLTVAKETLGIADDVLGLVVMCRRDGQNAGLGYICVGLVGLLDVL